MPTYDYRCTACDELFEVSRPMRSSESESCPSCDAVAKRVFTPVGVAFKGSGFHNTDYKKRPKEDAPACASASKSDSACSGCPAADS
jgi:putative FmdB family regulatory protein